MNAIILAAGRGNRLRPITDTIPKSLIVIDGEPIIERQIQFLKEIGIEEINIVVGYKRELFDYLKQKYNNVNLIFNQDFYSSNNIYSLFLCRHLLEDTFILEADIFLMKNFLRPFEQSTYYTSLKIINEYEWYFKINNKNKIEKIVKADTKKYPGFIGKSFYILSGISYWIKKDSKKIVDELNLLYSDALNLEKNKALYWDQIIYDNLNKINVYTEIIPENDWFEIDSLKDLGVLLEMLVNESLQIK